MTRPDSGPPRRGAKPSFRRTPRSLRRPTTRQRAKSSLSAMSTWTAQTTVNGRPEDVMTMLTDPEAIGTWAPIPFEVEGLESRRLETGSQARVVGRIVGQSIGFDVDVREVGPDRLELTASGP